MKTIGKLVSTIIVEEVRGHRPMSLICQALRNRFDLKVGGLAIRYDDTVATYQISADEKIGKARLAEIKAFADGVIVGMHAAGLL